LLESPLLLEEFYPTSTLYFYPSPLERRRSRLKWLMEPLGLVAFPGLKGFAFGSPSKKNNSKENYNKTNMEFINSTLNTLYSQVIQK
jgi:hypothetical protein